MQIIVCRALCTVCAVRLRYPDEAVAMILASREARQQADDGQAALLVHCSAGVGRTGTFIVIDQVMAAFAAGSREVDINNLVGEIRKDRMALVQHTVQYKFAYVALVTCWARTRKLPLVMLV